jgi:hypothetical protein
MLGSKIIIYGLAEQNPSLNSLSSISIFGNNSDFQLSVSENDVKWDLNEKGASKSVYGAYKKERSMLLNVEHLNPFLNVTKLSFHLPMIMPSVLAALCSAFQPLEGRVELAPFHFVSGTGFKRE